MNYNSMNYNSNINKNNDNANINDNNTNKNQTRLRLEHEYMYDFKLKSGNMSFYGMDLMDNMQSEDRNSMEWISDLIQFQWESVNEFNNFSAPTEDITKQKLSSMIMDGKKRWFARNKRLFTPPKLHTRFQGITSAIIRLAKRMDHLYFLLPFGNAERIPLYIICVWKNRDFNDDRIHNVQSDLHIRLKRHWAHQ